MPVPAVGRLPGRPPGPGLPPPPGQAGARRRPGPGTPGLGLGFEFGQGRRRQWPGRGSGRGIRVAGGLDTEFEIEALRPGPAGVRLAPGRCPPVHPDRATGPSRARRRRRKLAASGPAWPPVARNWRPADREPETQTQLEPHAR